MGLEFLKPKDTGGRFYTATARLYVNAERTQVVAEDSPLAHTLLVGIGGTLPEAEARKYGLLQEDKQEETEMETKVEVKPDATKSAAQGETKAVAQAPKTKAMQPQENK